MRVLARLHGMHEAVDSPAGIKKMKLLAADNLDSKDPGIYNQAIMEFGAMHCTPHQPKCDTCPFAADCVALNSGVVNVLPIKGNKTLVKEIWMYYFFVTQGQQVHLKRRNVAGIWKGLHDFPCIESYTALKDEEVIEEFLTQNKLASQAMVHDISEEYVHILSHRKIRAKFIEIKTTKTWKTAPEGTFVAQIVEIEKYGVPRLIDKYLKSKGLV
jgi:A/G-specific adenine glycosylase